MKTKYLTLFLLITALFFGCSKDDDNLAPPENSAWGSMDVRMTDAPANYTAVNVEVIGVEIQHNDTSNLNSGWVSLTTNTGIYNLLELRDSISVLIGSTDSFPTGKINQLRLILGDSNTVEIDSLLTFDLHTPSAQNTGLKINVNAEIKSNQRTEILLDFDAEKSIVLKADSSYLLKPVIKIKEVQYF